MKFQPTVILALVLGFSIIAFGAAAPKQGTEARFKQLDLNRSGKLSIKELWPDVKKQLTVEQTKTLYTKLDRNNDGEIESAEYRRIKKTIVEIKTGKAPAKKKKKAPAKKPAAPKK